MAPVAKHQSDSLVDKTVKQLADLKVAGSIHYKPNKRENFVEKIPPATLARFKKYDIDLAKGYPKASDPESIPKFIDEAFAIRIDEYAYIERGLKADPEKKALFGGATKVVNLTKKIGTEIVGLQLSELTDQQKDELALLVAERVVVFFRDQDLSPQKQLELGKYWGQVEVHPQAPQVPNGADGEDLSGITIIWADLYQQALGYQLTFKNHSRIGSWHTDLVHEKQPAGITHLHLDSIPDVGGDTLWSSGYAAYDKLSPAFQQFLDGKKAIYRSAHPYIDKNEPLGGPKHIEREHYLVRTHPVTGWKSLFLNRAMTVRIVGLLPKESDTILEYLFGIFEKNLDIQVRFNWQPTKPGLGTSAIWDNRVSQHSAVWDHEGEGGRHGTRVTSLAEIPVFDKDSPSQRQALGLSLD